MDGQRFDTLARGLASGRSRRNVLRLLGAGALGMLGVKATRDAEAAQECAPRFEACTQSSDCCSGSCDTTAGQCLGIVLGGTCAGSAQCENGGDGGDVVCFDGICTLEAEICTPKGETCELGDCCPGFVCAGESGVCVDGDNCGFFGDACEGAGDCCSGFCVAGVCSDDVCNSFGSTCVDNADCCGSYICHAELKICSPDFGGPTPTPGSGGETPTPAATPIGENPGNPEPPVEQPVTQLPSTGSGSDGGSGSLIAAAGVAGGAALFAAGKRIRSAQQSE